MELKMTQKEDGNTAVHYAAANGNLERLNYFCRESVDMLAKNKLGQKPIRLAIANGHLECAILLDEQESQPQPKDNEERDKLGRWLLEACRKGDEKRALMLIDLSADIHITDGYGRTPLHLACLRRTEQIVQKLIDLRANLHVKDDQGRTPLDLSCKKRKTNISRLLTYYIDKRKNNEQNT